MIIVGCGRVGSGLAVDLAGAGHEVYIIDKNPKSFRRLPPDWRGKAITGFGFDRTHLEQAGASEASALAAVTSGDNSNILTARIARETYEIPQVVARIYDPRRAEIFQRLGIPTVPSVSWTTDQVLRRLAPDQGSWEWTDSTETLHLVERLLPPEWAGRRLAEVMPPGVRIAAVTRAGTPTLKVRDIVGQEGDSLQLLVTRESEEALRKVLGGGDEAVPLGGSGGGDR